MTPHPTLAGLPEVFLQAAPELTLALPEETLATCHACVMAETFTAPARCCTYHPSLPNVLLGRILARGGEGARRLRARLATGEGVSAGGLHDPARRDGPGFGVDEARTCPFWEAGRCTIYADRGAMCRTWHCRYVRGEAGRRLNDALGDLLAALEAAAAEQALRELELPWTRDVDALEAFYRRCAALELDPVALAADPEVDRRRAVVRRAMEAGGVG